MTIRLKGGGSSKIRNRQRADVPGVVSVTTSVIVVSGESTNIIPEYDANFETYVGATYYLGGSMVLEGFGKVEVINLDPSVGSISEDGIVTRSSSGIMNLLIKNSFITIPLQFDLRDRTDFAFQPKSYASTVSGSLASHLQNQVDSRINSGMTMEANGLIFTTQNHATQTYVRNSNLWCADVNLTCISPWNNNGTNRKAGALVTPRHVIGAAHYEYNVGNTIRFVSQDGVVHGRTIAGKARHPDYTPYFPDLTIYALNSDLPETITPCKLMPANWNDYLVNNFQNRPPALGLDQEEKALIIDFNKGGSFLTPADSNRLIFHEDKITGDSGNPAFLIVNGELVLVTVWTYGGAGRGTPVSDHIAALNGMIATADTQAGVSTGYTVTEADFSPWPNFATPNYILGDAGGGAIEAWVIDGSMNGRPLYIKRGPGVNIYARMFWTGASWTVEPELDWDDLPDAWSETDYSGDDVATPDLATFEYYTFTEPA